MDSLKPQKALHLHEAQKVKSFRFSDYAVMVKYDGWYTYIDCVNGKWDVLRSRVGREIPSLRHLSEGFQSLTQTTDVRLIFEAVIPGVPFHEANGILNRKEELAQETVLHLHDVVEFSAPTLNFHTRYLACKLLYKALQDVFADKVQLVPILAYCNSEALARSCFENVVEGGGEGIILKELGAGYSFDKRNSTLLKIKEEVTKDLEVVTVIRGEGKYSDTLGALLVRNKAGTEFKVSGMTDLDRDSWWADPSKIVGQVVEVKAMKELEGGMLREPRFKAVRWDKTLKDID